VLQKLIMPSATTNPFSIRLTKAEKAVLHRAVAQVNCSRNAFIRTAVMSLAMDLSSDCSVEV
jgi:uncharacterized protein (DUF1778 family)